MKIEANTVQEYLDNIQEERKPAINRLRDIIKDNIPVGFEECISYGMIGYVVPHTIYPDGYHCNTKLPLPFLNIAKPKEFCSDLPYGSICQSCSYGMVYKGISQAL